MTPELAALMAHYNRWMNERLYAAAATLPEAELVTDRQAFFGSILATLNHIAVADTIWLHRFAEHPAAFASLQAIADVPRPASLRQPLATDLAGLRGYRVRLDALIERWVAELTAEHLRVDLDYTNMACIHSRRTFGLVLQHFFNHQTHHRGQVSTLLFQAGVDVGVTDLLAVIPETNN